MIVLWRITELCNLACGFCAYDKRLKRPRASADPELVAHGLRLFAEVADETHLPVHVSWLGGEPLLWRPLEDVMAPYAGGGRLRFSATTNGSTLHHARQQNFILNHFSELTISVDALAPTHDRLRGRSGLWQKVRVGVEALAAARAPGKLKLRANVVLMQSTLRDFEPLCLELAEWGMDEITFNALGGRDRPAFFPGERLLPQDLNALRERLVHLRAALAARGVKLLGAPAYLDRLSASAAGQTIRMTDCDVSKTSIFIDAQGRVSPCHFTLDDCALPISKLTTATDILQLPERFRAMQAVSPSSHCSNCLSTNVFGKFAA
jgi:AdoMet-dependent heme synthase